VFLLEEVKGSETYETENVLGEGGKLKGIASGGD